MLRCFSLSLCLLLPATGRLEALPLLETSELRDFDKLEEPRKKMIEAAITAAKEVEGMPYKYGGNGPRDGGFDCSGAVHYILHKIGIQPPRTSSDQFLWVRGKSEMHMVPLTAKDITDKAFADMKPGDLVFWAGTYEPDDGRKVAITHVAIFMGHEKKDGHPVMISASDGRSYRGKRGNGFGVYDFRVPRSGGKSRMIGFGTPPGLPEGG
ncbi:C40 family peptidase [Akkermansiaceae bacterium]|nr:C40 family peptidase [Akkermansiaceae bacterium]